MNYANAFQQFASIGPAAPYLIQVEILKTSSYQQRQSLEKMDKGYKHVFTRSK